MTLETYTIPEAAAALGQSEVNFKRWLARGWVPMPVMHETVRSYACFSRDEVDIVRTELNHHYREFEYFGEQHTETITRISQRIHGNRNITFGDGEGRIR